MLDFNQSLLDFRRFQNDRGSLRGIRGFVNRSVNEKVCELRQPAAAVLELQRERVYASGLVVS